MNLQELKQKTPTQLLEYAEELEIENAQHECPRDEQSSLGDD